MKKMNENQLQNLEAGIFWGWGDWNCNYVGAGQCFCNRTYYVFWIGVDTDYTQFTAGPGGSCGGIQ
ncbi:MAG: hypothetical protein R2816_10845 [Flavobacteriaceae bacterium]|nr:hypothetical protein [Ignavibacteriota bacterium]